VVFDEAYYEYVAAEDFPQTVPDYLKKGRNVFILRTFSKIYGLAGLRIGYGLGRAELVDYLERVRPPFNVSSLAQEAALAALKDTKHVARSVQANEDGKAFLYNNLTRLGLSYIPTSANFVFFDVGRKASDVADRLMRSGVIVRPMEGWGFPTCIRVTIGTEDENYKFINALGEAISS
jgi:histidinol-phosphate aminotransferase